MTTTRDEITDLVNRLGMVLDEGSFDDLRQLLADDISVRTPGGEATGRDAVVAQARRNHRPEQPIQHLITNLLIDLTGDRATARANLVVHFGPEEPPAIPHPRGAPLQLTMGEIYRFELTDTPAGWRFAHIETTPIWSTGTS